MNIESPQSPDSLLIEKIQSFALKSPQDLISYLFPSENSYTSLIQISKAVPKPRCGRPVKNNDLCFKCLDCTPEKFDHIFCEKCFRKGNHTGHRIKYRNNTYGFCDCGDENYIFKKSFCEDHQEKKIDFNELKGKIPKEIRRKLKGFLKKVFVKGIEIIEEFNRKNLKEDWNKELNEYVTSHRLLSFFIEFISWKIDDNFCFLIFFADFLLQKLSKKTKFFYHKCSDYEEISFFSEKQICECEILSILFRFNYFFSEDLNEKIVSLIFKLSPSQKLTNSVLNLLKTHANFMISLQTKKSILLEEDFENENSLEIHYYYSIFLKFYLFLNANSQVVTTFFTGNCEILLKKLRFFCEKLVVGNSNKTKTALDKLFHFYFFQIVKFKESIYEIVKQTSLLKEILKIFISLKTLKAVNLEEKINVLELVCNFLNFLRKVLKKGLEEKDFQKKQAFGLKIFEEIAKEIFENAKNECENLRTLIKNEDFIDFMYVSQNISNKIFSVFLGFFLKLFDFNYEETSIFLQKIVENFLGKNSQDFFEAILEEVVLSLYLDFLIQNSKTEKCLKIKKQESNIYSTSGTFFKAFDVFTLKFFFLSKNFNFSIEKIMKIIHFSSNYKQFNEISDKKDLFMMKFVLDLSIIFLFDDLSIINIINQLCGKKVIAISQGNFFKNKLNFLFINLFLINPQFKFESLKPIINIKEKELESIIQEIVDFNEKTKNFELKEQFRSKFDIFSFAESSQFYYEFFERATLIASKEKNISLLLGNCPESLLKERFELYFEAFYKKGFLNFILLVFLNEKHEKIFEENGALRLSIKLLYSLLEMSQFIKEFPLFLERKNEFLNRIKSLIKFKQEYEDALLKIKEKIEEITFHKEEISKNIEEEDPLEIRRKKNCERKKKILEDFNKKQMNFVSKNKENTLNFTSNSKNPEKEENLLCNLCFQTTKDTLAFICHISKDNLHALKLDKNSKPFEQISFYLSTCGHVIHKSCRENNRKFEKLDFLNFFNTNSEFFCSYCKSVSNILVPIIEGFCEFKNDIGLFFEKDMNLEVIDFSFLLEIIKKNDFSLAKKSSFVITDKKNEKFFQDFFDELLIATCFEEEAKEDLCITRFLDEILTNLFETIYLKNLTTFFINSKQISNNLLTLYRYYIENLDLNSQKAFFQKYQEKLIENMLHLSKMMNFKEFIEIYDSNFHLNLITSLLRMGILYLDTKNFINLIQNFVKIFVNQIFIIIVFALSENSAKISFEKIQVFLLEPDLKSKIIGFLSPLYFLILGILFTFLKPDKNHEKLIEDYLNFDHDIENSQLFKSFEAFLAPDSRYLKFLCEKSNFELSSISTKKIFEFKQKFLALNHYEIPWLNSINTYDDFVIEFMSKKCSVCGFYPRIAERDLYLCLFCSKVFCNGKCKKEINEENHEENHLEHEGLSTNEGNLTIHSKNSHAGNTVFINLLNGALFLFNYPRVVQTQSIFSSRFGKSFNQYTFDLKNYFLDKKIVGQLSNAYFNKRFPQEFFHQSFAKNNFYFKSPKWENL